MGGVVLAVSKKTKDRKFPLASKKSYGLFTFYAVLKKNEGVKEAIRAV